MSVSRDFRIKHEVLQRLDDDEESDEEDDDGEDDSRLNDITNTGQSQVEQ